MASFENERKDKRLSICVATLTRRRPEMLRALVDSWSALQLPENCDVFFLVCENDDKEYSRGIVSDYQTSFLNSNLRYTFEPELGIPFGRNRAARVAIEHGADLLLFVDDDEVVDPTWLERMITAYRNSKAVLFGAPLRAKPPEGKLSYLQRKMYDGIASRYAKKEKRAKRLASLNDTPGVTIVTNNWLGETSLFKDHNIWFDENMRFTGGTDTKFYTHVRSAGFSTGWISDAYVYETISPERLSFIYQYKRARDQSNTQIRRKHEENNTWPLMAIGGVIVKIVPSFLMVCLIPFTNFRTFLPAARSLGWIAGRLGYLSGKKSSLYSEVTGA